MTEGVEDLIAALKSDQDARHLADALWLAPYLANRTGTPDLAPHAAAGAGSHWSSAPRSRSTETAPPPPGPGQLRPEPANQGVYRSPGPAPDDDPAAYRESWAPSVPALPDKHDLVRALRPLRRTAPSANRFLIDEKRTADNVAELGLWLPVLQPQPQAWLDLALVADTHSSMRIWGRTIDEFAALVERLGAFRTVRRWHLDTSDPTAVRLTAASSAADNTDRPPERDPGELVDPTGKRLVLIATDCVGPAWREAVHPVLERWGRAGPVGVLQMLPQRLWHRCPVRFTAVRLSAPQPRSPNALLRVEEVAGRIRPAGVAVPVVELSSRWLAPWAGLVAGSTPQSRKGMALFTGAKPKERPDEDDPPARELSPVQLVQAFQSSASPTAARLAAYLAAAPLSLPIMRIVQASMLPDSRPGHLAEVFLGGLLEEVDNDETSPEERCYEFRDGVRAVLLASLTRGETIKVLRGVSAFLNVRAGTTPDFRVATAALDLAALRRLGRPFAQVVVQVLRAVGTPWTEPADIWDTDLKDLPFVDRAAVRSVAEADDPAAFPTVVDGAATRSGTPRPRPVTLPKRNPSFVGRRALLRDIKELLPTGPVVLQPTEDHQLGGIGRAQIAIEYAYRHASSYDLIWWIPAEQVSTVRASLVALATALRIPETNDVNRTLEAVRSTLADTRKAGRWLLVFENANRPEQLLPYVPTGGHVLITSRSTRWPEERTSALRIGPFVRQESVQFLRRRSPGIPDDLAERLAGSLRDEPMALEQAASYIAETGSSVSEYLALVEEHDQGGDRSSRLLVTWRLCLDQLRRTNPGAVRLLELAPFLASTPISTSMLADGLSAGPVAPGEGTEEAALRASLEALTRFGLALVDKAEDTVQIHQLVQGMTLLHHVPADAHVHLTDVVRRLLAAADPGRPDDPRTWQRYDELQPHLAHSDVVGSTDPRVRRLVLHQIRYLYLRGDFHGSAELSEQARARWATASGPYDPDVLTVAFHLANAQRVMGAYDSARDLNRETLRHQQRVYGPDHEATLATANSMGADLRIAGRFAEALALDSDNVDRYRRRHGPDAAATLRSVNNLAVDLRLLGRFAEARDLDEQNLTRRRALLAEGNPETLSSLGSVALDLYYLGRLTEAQELLPAELGAQRARLGADHPMVLFAGRYQAMILRALGRSEQARALAATIWALTSRRLGEGSVAGITALITLSHCYRTTGEGPEATRLLEQAMTRAVDRLGRTHPLAYSCQAAIAVAARSSGRHGAAERHARAAVSGLRSTLGDDHLFTIGAAVNLATIVGENGARGDAAAQLRQEIDRVRRLYGPQHHLTRVADRNLALLESTGAASSPDIYEIEPPPL